VAFWWSSNCGAALFEFLLGSKCCVLAICLGGVSFSFNNRDLGFKIRSIFFLTVKFSHFTQKNKEIKVDFLT
jgi:hypothetical protein